MEGPVVDAVLEGVLLGVEEEADATLGCEPADVVDGLGQVRGGGEALGELVKG